VDVAHQAERAPCTNEVVQLSTWDDASSQRSRLVILDLHCEGNPTPLKALLDTGASNNFVRLQTLDKLGCKVEDLSSVLHTKLVVRLANGATVTVPKRTLRMCLRYGEFASEDDFLVIELDEKFDVILGMPWMTRHQPVIDWETQSLTRLGVPPVRIDPTDVCRVDMRGSEGSIAPSILDCKVAACDGPADLAAPSNQTQDDGPGRVQVRTRRQDVAFQGAHEIKRSRWDEREENIFRSKTHDDGHGGDGGQATVVSVPRGNTGEAVPRTRTRRLKDGTKLPSPTTGCASSRRASSTTACHPRLFSGRTAASGWTRPAAGIPTACAVHGRAVEQGQRGSVRRRRSSYPPARTVDP